MMNLNQDIQASYHIIQLIEKSKQNSELIIENLPDIFFVIDGRGRVFKANQEACRFLKLQTEQALGFSLADALEDNHWKLIQSATLNLSRDQNTSSFEFSMVVGGSERIYLWSLSPFGETPSQTGKLYTLQGRDVTLLRQYQKKIGDIFATIPLGIFTVNSLGVIDDAFSEFTKWLLGRSDIAGKSLKELLYDPAKELMDVNSREGFKAIMDSVNRSLREYGILEETFPSQFYYPLPNSAPGRGRYLGIKVQNISQGDRVVGLLVVLEDRTLIVEAEQADERVRLLQDVSIERALQLKKADADLLEVTIQDLTRLFNEMGNSVMTHSSVSFKNALHSIKANARLIGLSNLQKLAHSLEGLLKEGSLFSWDVVCANIDTLLIEWREIVALRKVLNLRSIEAASKAEKRDERSLWRLYQEAKVDTQRKLQFESHLKALSKKELGSLEATLRGVASKSAEPSGKRVKMIFDWDRDLELDLDVLSAIRSSLIHIVTNAIDHGIETPLERSQKDKNHIGLIRLGSLPAKDGLVIFVEDDGRGLDVEKIKDKALCRGLITSDQVKLLSQADILDLIFASGFSTTEKTTDLSGRGVGLSAVREFCVRYGGNCKVLLNTNRMTRFELHFAIQE